MHRLLTISFLVILPLVGLLLHPQQRSRRLFNRPPSIASFDSSVRVIEICPFARSVVGEKPEVTLSVKASDPDDEPLLYQYWTTDGTISGEGRSVVWDLRGLPLGPHRVRVTVEDGWGGKDEASLLVNTVASGSCDPPRPPCPVIKVSCADEIDNSETFTFSALVVVAPNGPAPTSFNWKINAGRIVKGQNRRTIEVTTQGADGFDNITATVEVGGFDPSCAGTTVSCTTKIIR